MNTSYVGWDADGKCYTFDLWCMFAGWDGGTIHEALCYFKGMPMARKDAFCGMLMDAIDKGQLKDLECGWASRFTRLRLGLAQS